MTDDEIAKALASAGNKAAGLLPHIAIGDKKKLIAGLAGIVGGDAAKSVAEAVLSWKNRNDRLFEAFAAEVSKEDNEARQANLVARYVFSALSGHLGSLARGQQRIEDGVLQGLEAVTALRASVARIEETQKLISQGPSDNVGAYRLAFVKEVANLYRMLGYEVSPASDPLSRHADLIAKRKIPGADDTRIIIGCQQPKTNNEAYEHVVGLSQIFIEHSRAHGWHKAVIVTNGNFTTPVRTLARDSGHLVLKTVSELESETLNIYAAYGHYRRHYMKTSIHALYVPLGARGQFPGEPEGTDHAFQNVEAAIIEWIENGSAGFLTLMADFGAGKTTLLERLKFHYATSYEGDHSSVKPLLFRAKELHKHRTVDEYVKSTAQAEFGTLVDVNLIWQMIDEGRFLLLIDGFDEVAQQLDSAQRRKYFAQLSRLFNTPSHSILTCRPTFFIHPTEYERLIDEFLIDARGSAAGGRSSLGGLSIDSSRAVADLVQDLVQGYSEPRAIGRIRNLRIGRLDLSRFDQPQIAAYLRQLDGEFRRRVGKGWEEVESFLYAVYDIRDLMSRPILLDMICRTVVTGQVDITKHEQRLGAAEIYEAFIRALLVREHEQRETRRTISSDTRQQLIDLVAVQMYQKSALDISFELVADIVSEWLSTSAAALAGLRDQAAEHVTSDIILTGFLTLDEDNRFRFAHKSFMEFLVARRLMRGAGQGALDPIGEAPIPRDIVYFMGALVINDRQLLENVTRCARTAGTSAQWRNNIGRALVASGAPLSDFSFGQADVSQIGQRTVHWRSADLSDLVLDVEALEQLLLEGCTLRKVRILCPSGTVKITNAGELSCSIESCKLQSVHISDCEGAAQLLSGTAESVEIVRSSLTFESRASVQRLLLCDCTGVIDCPAASASRVELIGCEDVRLGQLVTSALDIRQARVSISAAFEVSADLTASGEGRQVVSWVDSQIEIGAFASHRTLSLSLLRSQFLIRNCRLAGVEIEPGAETFIHHSQSEGVLFVSSREERSSALVRHEGRLLIIERSVLMADDAVARRALDRADEIMGSWIATWTRSVRDGLERRRVKSGAEPQGESSIGPR